jgi:hypothetical protein
MSRRSPTASASLSSTSVVRTTARFFVRKRKV